MTSSGRTSSGQRGRVTHGRHGLIFIAAAMTLTACGGSWTGEPSTERAGNTHPRKADDVAPDGGFQADDAQADGGVGDGSQPDSGGLALDGGPACGSCHTLPPSTGQHEKHAVVFGFPCSTCHADTVDADRNIIDPTRHRNGTKDVEGMLLTFANGACTAMCHAPPQQRNW